MTQETQEAAQRAVKNALQLEMGDAPYRDVETQWDRAERLYEEAGLDPMWFDRAGLTEVLDEPEPPMATCWLFPTDRVEMTYNPEGDDVDGVIACIDDVVDVRP